MIDFACKKFDINEIIKCGLSLTRAEFKMFLYLSNDVRAEMTTQEIADALDLDLTTVQKGVKKLSDSDIIVRRQKNLSTGGYVFVYVPNNRAEIRRVIKGIISSWSEKVLGAIDGW